MPSEDENVYGESQIVRSNRPPAGSPPAGAAETVIELADADLGVELKGEEAAAIHASIAPHPALARTGLALAGGFIGWILAANGSLAELCGNVVARRASWTIALLLAPLGLAGQLSIVWIRRKELTLHANSIDVVTCGMFALGLIAAAGSALFLQWGPGLWFAWVLSPLMLLQRVARSGAGERAWLVRGDSYLWDLLRGASVVLVVALGISLLGTGADALRNRFSAVALLGDEAADIPRIARLSLSRIAVVAFADKGYPERLADRFVRQAELDASSLPLAQRLDPGDQLGAPLDMDPRNVRELNAWRAHRDTTAPSARNLVRSLPFAMRLAFEEAVLSAAVQRRLCDDPFRAPERALLNAAEIEPCAGQGPGRGVADALAALPVLASPEFWTHPLDQGYIDENLPLFVPRPRSNGRKRVPTIESVLIEIDPLAAVPTVPVLVLRILDQEDVDPLFPNHQVGHEVYVVDYRSGTTAEARMDEIAQGLGSIEHGSALRNGGRFDLFELGVITTPGFVCAQSRNSKDGGATIVRLMFVEGRARCVSR